MAVAVGLSVAGWQARADSDETRWLAMMEPASVAHLTGAYQEAEFRYLKALELAERFDATGDFLERSMAGLGGVYYSQRRFAEAAAFYREALAIATALYGGGHDRAAVIDIYRETLAAADAALTRPGDVADRSASFVFSKEGAAIPLRGRLPTRPTVAEARGIPAAAQTPPPAVRPRIALPTHLPLRGMPVAAFEARLVAGAGASDGAPSAGGPVQAEAPAPVYGSGPLVVRITPREDLAGRAAEPERPAAPPPPGAGAWTPKQVAVGGDPPESAALRALQADPLAPPNVSPRAIAAEQAEEEARRRALVERHPVLGIRLPSAKRNTGPIFPGTPRLADTEKAYVEELEARRMAYGQRNPEVADLFYRLARLYHRQSRYELAETMYESCLAAREKLLPEGHPEIIETLKHYIRLMRASGFPEKAADLKARMKEHQDKAKAVQGAEK